MPSPGLQQNTGKKPNGTPGTETVLRTIHQAVMPVPKKKPRTSSEHLPVFVYGTLRPGQKNYARFLAGRTTEELPATVPGHLYIAEEGGYPFLQPGEGWVIGTLMVLAPDQYVTTLKQLDHLENYDPENEATSLYLRRRTKAILTDDSRAPAWVYYWNRPWLIGRRIKNGDFSTAERLSGD